MIWEEQDRDWDSSSSNGSRDYYDRWDIRRDGTGGSSLPTKYNDSLQTDYNDSLQTNYDDAMTDKINHHSGSNGAELMAPLFGHMQEEYESILSYACPDNLQRNVYDNKFCNEFDYQKKVSCFPMDCAIF